MERIVCTLNLYDNGMHQGARDSQADAARRWGARYVELTEPLYALQDPFIEKLSLEKRFPSARVIFFDRDVVVRSDCPNLFERVPEGSFGAVPSEQEGHLFLHEIVPSIDPLLKALNLQDRFNYERDYFNSGMLVFDLPTHQAVFEKARSLLTLTDCRQWEVYDQGLLAVAVQATGTPFRSLEHTFNRCGERLWSRWQPEMTEFVWHFCNMNNPEHEINNTRWRLALPDMLFEKVFVINLKRREDRRQQMLKRMAQAGLTCPVEFVEAVDGMELSHEVGDAYRPYEQWEDSSSTNEWYNRPLKMGEIGCSLSHYRVWQKIQQEKRERTLIIEDDAILSDDFVSKCQLLQQELPGDWELLYLYRFRLPITQDQRVSERVVVPGFSHCSVAYVVRLGAVEKMLKSGFIHNLIPIDEFLPCLYADEARADVKDLFSLRLKTYASCPDLVMQDDKQKMGSDTEASAFLGGARG